LRLLHVIGSLDPRQGGPAEGVRQIARAARRLGHETTVVSLDRPGMPFLEDEAFRSVALGPGVLRYGYCAKLVPWLRAHAPEFDAVIVDGIWQYTSLAAWRALRADPTPYFVFVHGMLDPWFRRAYPLKHVKKILYWLLAEHRVLRDARAVLFTGEEERRLARDSFRPYRAREVVTGYGIAAPDVDLEAAKEAFLAASPALRGRRLLLYLGRIHEKKGCDLLIDAFARAARDRKDIHLVMAGPGEGALVRRLQAQAGRLGIAARVTWTGMLAGTQKWGALRAAEAFVLPSHQENFGIAVTEALACGTPVLISDKVNIWREIEREGCGLVAADTPDGTRSLLARWLDLDAPARESMRSRTAAGFRRFDVQTTARTILDLVAAARPSAGTPGAAPPARELPAAAGAGSP
jgi:glycosyltransferase involved in cell wall biosynthesis